MTDSLPLTEHELLAIALHLNDDGATVSTEVAQRMMADIRRYRELLSRLPAPEPRHPEKVLS